MPCTLWLFKLNNLSPTKNIYYQMSIYNGSYPVGDYTINHFSRKTFVSKLQLGQVLFFITKYTHPKSAKEHNGMPEVHDPVSNTYPFLQMPQLMNIRDYCGWLPLHEASNHGYEDIVEYLVDHGAHINDRGGEKCGGITPLHDASACGNLEVIQSLVKKGANVHAKDDEVGEMGRQSISDIDYHLLVSLGYVIPVLV